MAARCASLRALACTSRMPAYRMNIHGNSCQKRSVATGAAVGKALSAKEIEEVLDRPTWSVSSLMPDLADKQNTEGDMVTSEQLRKLLRLSALPPPASSEEEASMLSELRAQLHFVAQMQRVDTSGVEPLRAIRDETQAAVAENTIGLDTLKEALAKEEVVGKFHKRIRRRPGPLDEHKTKLAEDWDVLGQASKKVGRFFVVESDESASS